MSKWIPGLKKAKAATKAVPRTIEEISQQYADVCRQAGQSQYQVYVHTQEVERLHKLMVSLNQEAGARQQLDTETKTKEETKEQGVG